MTAAQLFSSELGYILDGKAETLNEEKELMMKFYTEVFKKLEYDISEENSGDVMREWNIKIGRQNTYDYLKELVKNEAIDPNTSFIIAGDLFGFDDGDKINIKFNDISPATVFRFLKIMRENNKVLDGDETFDINEFDINGASGDTTIVQV